MRGSVAWQISEIFKKSGIFRPGESKHLDKEQAKQSLAGEGLSATSQRISSHTKLHSYSAGYDYKETWLSLGKHARELGLKDMTRISQEHVQSFLNMRREQKIAHGTWKKEASHIGKLGNALTLLTGQKVDFREAINLLRPGAKDALENPDRDRGFVDPRAVVSEIKNPLSQLVATLQLEGGARCHEVTQIRADQLREGNQIDLKNTKGGMPRTITVRAETFARLQQTLNERGGMLRVNQSTYRSQVAEAARQAGETNTGTHDLRYNFAREKYLELTKAGFLPEQAHFLISEEMGHHRPDITLHYLA